MGKERRIYKVLFGLMVASVFFLALVAYLCGLSSVTKHEFLFLGLDMGALLVSLTCYFVILVGNEEPWVDSDGYMKVFAIPFSVFFFDILVTILKRIPEFHVLVSIGVSFCYLSGTLMSLAFVNFMSSTSSAFDEESRWLCVLGARIVAVVFTVLSVLNYWFGFFFSVSTAGEVMKASHYLVGYTGVVANLSFILIPVLRSDVGGRRKGMAGVYFFITPLGIILGFVYSSISLPFIFAVFTLILMYIGIYNRAGIELAEAREELGRKAQEEQDQEQQVLLSQIQPHFIFNTLSVIAALSRKDPELASRTTSEFASYLKDNLESISSHPLSPFKAELEHIRKYANIQKVRFGSDLTVVYDIGPEDFLVPSLSIQPLVENAIIHGIIRGKQEAGTVTISTYEDASAYYVRIQDDGIGFDVNQRKKNDGRVHVGLENSRERVKALVGGRVDVASTIGVGTVQTIVVPKEVKA